LGSSLTATDLFSSSLLPGCRAEAKEIFGPKKISSPDEDVSEVFIPEQQIASYLVAVSMSVVRKVAAFLVVVSEVDRSHPLCLIVVLFVL